jgi:hypothetical protein
MLKKPYFIYEIGYVCERCYYLTCITTARTLSDYISDVTIAQNWINRKAEYLPYVKDKTCECV